MNLAAAFRSVAEKSPEKPAVFWGEDEFTYGALLAQADWLTARLAGGLGVQRGDRVGLWLKNCPQFVPALFGVLGAGGAVVPINNFLKPDEVNFILHDAGVSVLVTDATMAEATAKLQALRPGLRVVLVEEFGAVAVPGVGAGADADADAGATLPPLQIDAGDMAVLIYTSGTTGRPKGAVLSHGNLLHNVESCRVMLAALDHDRFVVLLPMFHSFMLTVGVLLPLLIGGSLVVVRSMNPAKNIVQEIILRQATILPAVPQLFRMLAGVARTTRLPLRLCISGGAPLPVEILREFSAAAQIPLLEGYGLSETSPVASMNPIAGPWKEGSVGVPVPNVEMSVQDDEGRLLAARVTGEICVRGGNVMQGYWNQPAETAKAIRAGWLLTGDIGFRDEDGYYFITDRKKDMLLVNGINVYPREIEERLYEFPGVKEAAVIGIPDARKGEQPLAFVAATDGATLDPAAIRAFLRERLADYKVPRRIILLPALPRNATGKILKTALRGPEFVQLASGAEPAGA